jgi:hypothetical protein
LKLNQSILKETTQETLSFFLTAKRLFQIRTCFDKNQAVTCDSEDGTEITDFLISDIRYIKKRYQIRKGEIIAGFIITGFAFIFRGLLLITGTMMAILGIMGMAHGLFLPTRWVEIGRISDHKKINIFAPGKKSARILISELKNITSRSRAKSD